MRALLSLWPVTQCECVTTCPLSVTLVTGQCVPCSYLAAASVELTSCAPH